MTDDVKRGVGRPKKQDVNKELAEANEALGKQNESLHEELAAMKAKFAKNTQVSSTKRVDAEDFQVGQDGTAKFENDELVKVSGVQLDDPLFKEKMDNLKFMEEPVTVEILESNEDLADAGFVIAVNNKQCVFRRGEVKTVKRYFVEGLARSKKTGYGNKLVVDPDTGVQEYQYPSRTGLRYPFSVIDDKNPKGREWLQSVLRQP